jgi:hypothetical protein
MVSYANFPIAFLYTYQTKLSAETMEVFAGGCAPPMEIS